MLRHLVLQRKLFKSKLFKLSIKKNLNVLRIRIFGMVPVWIRNQRQNCHVLMSWMCFFWSLKVLHGGPRINILQFLIKKKINHCKFLKFCLQYLGLAQDPDSPKKAGSGSEQDLNSMQLDTVSSSEIKPLLHLDQIAFDDNLLHFPQYKTVIG
jgi:hypothetical protein